MKRWFRQMLSMAILLASGSAWCLQLPGPLVETDWLARHLEDSALVVLDVRADAANFAKAPPAKPDPRAPLVGHIPSARLWTFDKVRETRVIDGVKLDKMAPTRESFTTLMRALGVRNNDAVVVVANANDTGSLTQATRAYWTLKYFGHDNVALLNGGTWKWVRENRPLSHVPVAIPASDYLPSAERRELLATTDEVQHASRTGSVQLVDGRTANYYVGQSMTADVTAKGHIPRARMLAHVEIADEKTKLFKSPAELRALAQEMGIDPARPAISYCNTGHLASGPWFVLSELLGNKQVKLYDGSMHEWSKDASRPVTRKWEMN
jgi:thiosulfate/3-mercaptopyruvate sulfurtransferase